MRTIAHIADLHFGTEDPHVAEVLLSELYDLKPSLIVISGDLTQRARKKEFIAAREYLNRMPKPYLVVPGNHDIPLFDIIRRFFAPLNYAGLVTRQVRAPARACARRCGDQGLPHASKAVWYRAWMRCLWGEPVASAPRGRGRQQHERRRDLGPSPAECVAARAAPLWYKHPCLPLLPPCLQVAKDR